MRRLSLAAGKKMLRNSSKDKFLSRSPSNSVMISEQTFSVPPLRELSNMYSYRSGAEMVWESLQMLEKRSLGSNSALLASYWRIRSI